jgi:hypothetical protein
LKSLLKIPLPKASPNSSVGELLKKPLVKASPKGLFKEHLQTGHVH